MTVLSPANAANGNHARPSVRTARVTRRPEAQSVQCSTEERPGCSVLVMERASPKPSWAASGIWMVHLSMLFLAFSVQNGCSA